MNKKANVLITGANGFLGSALVRQLTQQFNVKTLIRKTSDLTNLKGQAVEVVEGDLRFLVTPRSSVKRGIPRVTLDLALTPA